MFLPAPLQFPRSLTRWVSRGALMVAIAGRETGEHQPGYKQEQLT
jgi:hypothetical protein